MRIETSQKCAKGVHLRDLADYLDKPRQVRQREMRGSHSPQHYANEQARRTFAPPPPMVQNALSRSSHCAI
ncbi:pyocin activator PrtN family protein [Devosia sp.]|uniref:pyocin activator PrtN family protein n=1 Tax=Devosia sp. TaxID=1871048 RepID=UPI002FC8E8F2